MKSDGEFGVFKQAIDKAIPPDRLFDDALTTLAYGTDASFYRLIPRLVIRANSIEDVQLINRLANAYGVALTYRAAGTSLSGQAITDSVLVQLGESWRGHRMFDDGKLIALQPGLRGGDANRLLKPYQRKIGPDPASIDTAQVGGIAANNASGMCCGTAQNSYQTLHAMQIILADGSCLDTASAESRQQFAQTHARLLQGLDQLARDTKADAALAEKITRKFSIKNTTGFSLNALVDFDDPFDILQHLMIGSEGTLGFIAEITYHTVADLPHKAAALVFFPSVEMACQAVPLLLQTPVSAVELIDRAGLAAVQGMPGMSDNIRTLSDGVTALLIDTRAGDSLTLNQQIAAVSKSLAGLAIIGTVHFSTDKTEYERYWAVRKGLFPAVGAMRETGTTVVIEDIAFPLQYLAAAVEELQQIFIRYGYDDALIFGHALAGNLHFVFSQAFDSESEVRRYQKLMDAVADLVVARYHGSLKAEHGTGRNMAPFVEYEWGSVAYALMQKIKALLDPGNILNPGVILNDNPKVHLQNLKPMPAANPIIDKCIECGFCEPACPSKDLTLTPRQRIATWREIRRLQTQGVDKKRLRALEKAYDYQGNATCAACGLCANSCPVNINTGDLTRAVRSERNRRYAGVARWLATHFGFVVFVVRTGLRLVGIVHRLVGTQLMIKVAAAFHRISRGFIPLWTSAMPRAAPALRQHKSHSPASDKVVYFPSCASRTMGPAASTAAKNALPAVMESVLSRAGYQVIYPQGVDSLCCGMPFESKGFIDSANQKTSELIKQLKKASNNGEHTIVFDTSPCVQRTRKLREAGLKILDATEFLYDDVLPRLTINPLAENIALHITCSSRNMGLAEKTQALARACASEVTVPTDISCCGFAGDKGFTLPELNASALDGLKASLPDNCQRGFSTSRTCEIGLSHHSGIDYQSLVYLVDEASSKRR